ncbi:MAG: hypothetical protein IPG28_07910 [Betaproteobacteria bacterium]|nr:hypothetical protein [Betaproteobacteria bacterium]
MKWIFRLLVPAGLALALGAVHGLALAAEPRWENALAGRLRQIKETGVARLGYRERATPFFYVGAEGRPVGHTLDLCRAIVRLYDRWFVRPLPSGERIGLPMGTQLRRSLELLGLPPE